MIKLLRDRVLIKPEKYITKTESGLDLHPDAFEESFVGEIISVGPGTKEYPITVKVGDKIHYGPFKRDVIEIKGVTHLIMREADLIGVYEKDS